MLRTLIDDLVRQRLWPIAALAVLVAVGAPLLLLHPATDPVAAPAVPAAQGAERAAPAAGTLPPDVARLIGVAEPPSRPKARGASKDPFEPPAGRAGSDAGDTPDKGAGAPVVRAPVDAGPIPVVIQDGGGARGATPVTVSPTPTPAAPSAPSGTPAARPPAAPESEPESAQEPGGEAIYAVDVRFGKRQGTAVRRELQRGTPLGAPHAVFVKYSPNRDKAVFAVPPGTMVTGPVHCRRKQGVCRYVDVPAGSYARLTLRRADGRLVRRRLDVVRVQRRSAASPAAAARERRGTAEGRCVVRRVLALEPGHGWPAITAVPDRCG